MSGHIFHLVSKPQVRPMRQLEKVASSLNTHEMIILSRAKAVVVYANERKVGKSLNLIWLLDLSLVLLAEIV